MAATTIGSHPYGTHFHALDALRGIAAAAVLFLHGMELLNPAGFVPNSAVLAVDFFFMLSGFVLAHAYEKRLRFHLLSWRGFMFVRLVRLYPMILMGTALGGAVFILGQIHKTHQVDSLVDAWLLGGSLLLFPVGFTKHVDNLHQAYPLNNPVWSLFFELAVGTLYSTRFGRMSTKQLVHVLALSAFCLIFTVVFWKGGGIGFASPGAFFLGFVRVSYPFWAGIAIWRFSAQKFSPIPFFVPCLLLGSLLVLPSVGKPFSLTVILLVFPAIIALGARVEVPVRLIPLCSVLGELSYPVYLIHQPIFRIVKNLHVGAVSASPTTGFLGGGYANTCRLTGTSNQL